MQRQALTAFLRGKWNLTKTLDYKVGGGVGHFTGAAIFDPWSAPPKDPEYHHQAGVTSVNGGVEGSSPSEDESWLNYSEEGHMVLEGSEGPTAPMPCKTQHAYRCDVCPMEVYFVGPGDGRKTAAGTISYLFHTLNLDQSQADDFFHPCPPDEYYGSFRVLGGDSFQVRWRIVGPHKDGVIVGTYTRP